jgi:hypothetical protein
MPTLRDLVHETKRHLLSSDRPVMNKLATAIGTTDTTITFTHDTTQIQAGAYLEIDLEVMYVWESRPASKAVTVERAQLGSVAAPHTAGTLATLNPRFPDFVVVKALNDDLADLSSPMNGLFAVRTVELTATANSAGYDLTGATGIQEVLAVSTRHPGQPRTWMPVTNFALDVNAETDDFASGVALTLHEGVHPGQPLRVVYKAAFAPLVNLTDDVTAVAGLPTSMHDLPPMGAAMRLVAPREIRRNFIDSQGDSRRSAEVPPGAIGASARELARIRRDRILSEAARLARQYPERSALPVAHYSYG